MVPTHSALAEWKNAFHLHVFTDGGFTGIDNYLRAWDYYFGLKTLKGRHRLAAANAFTNRNHFSGLIEPSPFRQP